MYYERGREYRREREEEESDEYESETVWIPIENISVGSSQRNKIDAKKIEEHRVSFERGDYVMPIRVVRIDAEEVDKRMYRILGNGRHRYFGALDAGMSVVPAVINDSRAQTQEIKKAA